MIKILNRDKQALHLLAEMEDYYIESDIESGDKIIHFLIPKRNEYYTDLKQENYVETATELFLIKEINLRDKDYVEVFGKLALEDLKSKVIQDFESLQSPISSLLGRVLLNTGWDYALYDVPNKLRTVRAQDKTAHGIIMDAVNTYQLEVSFDTKDNLVKIHSSMGADRGSYVHSDLNMKSMEFQSDTYDFRTRLYAYGADGLTFADINEGKEYVEDNSYSNKILETVWRDDRYTDEESLLNDARAKLEAIAKPRLSYKVELIQLTTLNPLYSILDYRLGDKIKILDKDTETIDKQRVVKLIEYPLTPEKNKIELANSILTFRSDDTRLEDIEQEAINIRTDLIKEIERTNALIGYSSTRGFIIMRKNEDGEIYEQLIMDTDDIATATSLWRWNINGLAYSSSGYNGDYKTAITADGRISADFITTGQLNAELVRAGVLSSQDGGTWIDLDTGYFNFKNNIIYNEEGLTILMPSGKTISEEIDYKGEEIDNRISRDIEDLDVRVSEANKGIDDFRTYFTFDENGLTLGKANSPVNIVISNEEIQFKEGQKKVAYINGQRMYIGELEIEDLLRVGVHQIKKYDGDTTLIEYVGGE